MAPTAADLQGLIAACDRALGRLRDPTLPGITNPVLIEHVEQVRTRAQLDLAALECGL